MKRKLGIARCGLACCLCSANDICHGCNSSSCPGSDHCENRRCSLEKGISHCYVCEQPCQKGMFGKIKPFAFTLFSKDTASRLCWIAGKPMKKRESSITVRASWAITMPLKTRKRSFPLF